MLRIVVLFLMSTVCANAVTLTQTVPEDILFDLTPLAPVEAGDYFESVHTRDLTYLSIDNIPNDVKWTVYAKLSNEIPGIALRVRREDSGTGTTVPTGGKSYSKLTPIYIEIFSGKGKRFDIPMRTKISGIGVSDDHGTHNSNIEYKIETE